MLRYLHIAPRKVRLVGGTLVGLSAREAEAQLMLRPQRSAGPLLKLLRSAVANAGAKGSVSAESLKVASLRVDQGPMLKRSLPRAQGRATPIHKKMSHVTITLEEVVAAPSRFVVAPPPKKEKKAPKRGHSHDGSKADTGKGEKPKENSGIFKRMFRRKSV
jgi:large subunit ribosomal protein L22